jgi:DNA mismatch repair ATPase MutS
MIFNSILYPNKPEDYLATDQIPPFFSDLNLDKVIETIINRKQQYELACFYYSPLEKEDAIVYRQEIFRDLENETIFNSVNAFAEKMILVRRYLGVAEKSYYPYHQTGWYLEAALEYCDAINILLEELSRSELQSQGLKDFFKWLGQYHHSQSFSLFNHQALDLKTKLKSIQYNVIIKNLSVSVRKYDSEQDYNLIIEEFFSKFKHNEVRDFRVDLIISSGMNHVTARILDIVAKLFPEEFSQLTRFSENYPSFVDETIKEFDREIQFYVAYVEFIKRIKSFGFSFCYPKINSKEKAIHAFETFDIGLADKHCRENKPVIFNDFYLEGHERIFIITGANQGGKTTFARMFGQLHFLACLGCPVPGRESTLFLFDQIFTHFEQEEDIQNLRGKLKDDLVRIYRILEQATSKSVIIMNEIFTSTSLHDARFLSKKILEKIIELDAISVCVTFIDELSTLGQQTVSLVSTVDPDNPAIRTFKQIRKPADGRAYAFDLAKQHALTPTQIKERIRQ